MLNLAWLRGFEPLAVLLLRAFVGVFLIYGVWDNITSLERMEEFERFLRNLHCPLPWLAARVSVWAQFAIGVLLVPGLLTRWAGLLLTVNFVVAVLLLQGSGASFRELFPPGILVAIGLYFATAGAGRWSLDHGVLKAR
jgi:putative oxidoreductase